MFPVPRAEDSIVIPEWAIGIIIAAVLVSLIWIVAIVVLVSEMYKIINVKALATLLTT